MRAATLEVADVLRLYGREYLKNHSLPLTHLRAISAIKACRTSSLGGHIDSCDTCDHERISYNSCRNRHCPKCQFLTKERWIDRVSQDLLPIPYFHVVFTVPQELNEIARFNQKLFYGLLFKASSETLKTISLDKKHLGAKTGFISVLHTWGQNLMFHPHVHCIVMGGGLSPDKKKWISSKPDYFLPVKVLSRMFRGKMLAYLTEAMKAGELAKAEIFTEACPSLYEKEWVVYAKPPFQKPENVVKYLGRYTHRIAISNQRIIDIDQGKVSFLWRDYRDNTKKIMRLDAAEFIRRFLLHILPKRFVKVRYYGLLSNRYREDNISLCCRQLNYTRARRNNDQLKENCQDFLLRVAGIDIKKCPVCKTGKIVSREIPAERNRLHETRSRGDPEPWMAAGSPPQVHKCRP